MNEVIIQKLGKSSKIECQYVSPSNLHGLSQVLAAILGKHSVTPLIRPYKAKEGNRALCNSRTYIHSGLTCCDCWVWFCALVTHACNIYNMAHLFYTAYLLCTAHSS